MILSGSENQFRSPVAATANVSYIGLTLNNLFGTAKIANDQMVVLAVDKDVVGLNVSVNNI